MKNAESDKKSSPLPMNSRDVSWLNSLKMEKELENISYEPRIQRIINTICGVIFGTIIIIFVLFSQQIIEFAKFSK